MSDESKCSGARTTEGNVLRDSEINPKVEIRLVQPEEFEEAGRVTASAWEPWDSGDDVAWRQFSGRIADVASRARIGSVYVAVRDGHILGSVTLELSDRIHDDTNPRSLGADEAHVRMLGIDPAERRQGIARALMQHCIEVARDAGKRRLTLNTSNQNSAAQALYEAMGFLRGGDLVDSSGFRTRTYEKDL